MIWQTLPIWKLSILVFWQRQSRIATNVRRVVKAANGKPVLFFPARYDTYQTQESDGYAAMIGGIKGFSTDANALASNGKGLGTIPHALIAAYNGDTLAATSAFDKYVAPDIARIALVDFDNDCVGTTLQVALQTWPQISRSPLGYLRHYGR